MSKKVSFWENQFGGMFDFNGDGKENLGEQWIAMNIFDECTKEDERENEVRVSTENFIKNGFFQPKIQNWYGFDIKLVQL